MSILISTLFASFQTRWVCLWHFKSKYLRDYSHKATELLAARQKRPWKHRAGLYGSSRSQQDIMSLSLSPRPDAENRRESGLTRRSVCILRMQQLFLFLVKVGFVKEMRRWYRITPGAASMHLTSRSDKETVLEIRWRWYILQQSILTDTIMGLFWPRSAQVALNRDTVE